MVDTSPAWGSSFSPRQDAEQESNVKSDGEVGYGVSTHCDIGRGFIGDAELEVDYELESEADRHYG